MHVQVTDPLCKPFSMGRNLFCVHSKKRLDDIPELKAAKQKQNRTTLVTMAKMFNQASLAPCVWCQCCRAASLVRLQTPFALSCNPFNAYDPACCRVGSWCGSHPAAVAIAQTATAAGCQRHSTALPRS
jgi:hypothetical protein